MKVFIILIIVIYGTHSFPKEFDHKWATFKVSYNRTYINGQEELFRYRNFVNNLELIEAHNEKYQQGLVSYTMGINQFTDMTLEEIQTITHGLIEPVEEPEPLYKIHTRNFFDIPASLDWRDKGVVTPVKEQGFCGACWAFASTGAIESQERIAQGADLDISLSEQQLIDCVPDSNCGGGWMTDAYNYIVKTGGIESEVSYPYYAENGHTCLFKNKIAAQIKGYASLAGPDENMMAEMIVTHGPVSVALDATGLSFYKGGVYYNKGCNPINFTHAVLIVGYGNEDGQDYWLAKNSWGSYWGLNGYFKIARNRNNHCGIASKVSVPVL